MALQDNRAACRGERQAALPTLKTCGTEKHIMTLPSVLYSTLRHAPLPSSSQAHSILCTYATGQNRLQATEHYNLLTIRGR